MQLFTVIWHGIYDKFESKYGQSNRSCLGAMRSGHARPLNWVFSHKKRERPTPHCVSQLGGVWGSSTICWNGQRAYGLILASYFTYLSNYLHSFSYNILILILTYFLPIISMTVTYSRVGIELWGSKTIGEYTPRQVENVRSKRRVSRTSIYLSLYL